MSGLWARFDRRNGYRVWFFGGETRRSREQRNVVEAITQLGGDVVYDRQCDEFGITSSRVDSFGPQWLRNLVGIDFLGNVVSVHASYTDLTDDRFEHLTTLVRLRVLY